MLDFSQLNKNLSLVRLKILLLFCGPESSLGWISHLDLMKSRKIIQKVYLWNHTMCFLLKYFSGVSSG